MILYADDYGDFDRDIDCDGIDTGMTNVQYDEYDGGWWWWLWWWLSCWWWWYCDDMVTRSHCSAALVIRRWNGAIRSCQDWIFAPLLTLMQRRLLWAEQNRMCRLTSSPGTEWCTGRVWRTGIIQSKIFSPTPQCFLLWYRFARHLASFSLSSPFWVANKTGIFFRRCGETYLGNQGHTRRWEGDCEESKGVMTVVTFCIFCCHVCRFF